MTFLDRYQANGRSQLIARHRQHCRCGTHGIQCQWITNRGPQCSGNHLCAMRLIDTSEPRGFDPTEHQISIGDRGLCTTSPVTHWAGLSTGAFRSHTKQSSGINVCNRPPASTDGVNINHRYMHRHTISKILFGTECRCSTKNQTDIKTGTPHITGNQIFKSSLPTDVSCCNRARCWT